MAGKSNGVEKTSEWMRTRPDAGPLWLRAAKIVYDPDEKAVFGRTAKRWGILLVFYLVFYLVLAALFAVCMAGLLLTLDSTRPTYTLDRSLIGTNPGVSFRPIPLKGFIVAYDISDPEDYEPYIEQLKEFLTPYESSSRLDLCSAVHNYGFPETPCFFIKLNKIFDWKPECYDVATNKLPDDMPQELQDHILDLNPSQRSQIWVSCWEEQGNSTDIEYTWGRALSSAVYRNQRGFLGSVLAIRLTPPVDTLVAVRCRAWAKNILYNKGINEASGYARILLQLSSGPGSNSTDAPV